jgi:phosphatidylinositol 3-kinase
MFKQVSVVNSCNLDHFIAIKIGALEGEIDGILEGSNTYYELSRNRQKKQTVVDLVRNPQFPSSTLSCQQADMYIECGLYLNGCLLCPTQKTSYKKHNKMDWKEWIVFPVQYKDVTFDTKFCLTIWDIFSPRKPVVIGGTTFNLFDLVHTSHSQYCYMMKSGNHKLKIWRKKKADFSNENTTPGEMYLMDNVEIDEVTRIEKIWMNYKAGSNEEWLDRITANTINEKKKEYMHHPKRREDLFLDIEFPTFEYPIIYNEDVHQYKDASRIDRNKKEQQTLNVSTQQDNMITTITPSSNHNDWIIVDTEINMDNPCALKHMKLAIHISTGFLDTDLRPEANEKKLLTMVINSTPLQEITSEQKTIIWKYRYWLLTKKRALTKFLKCVDWGIMKESYEATGLMKKWAEIDIVDALELLSSFFCNVDVVRRYAVEVLKKASNEEIIGILLQLVQALRYEKDMRTCDLADFLLDRALVNFDIANHLNWYLLTESDDPIFGDMYTALYKRFLTHLKKQAEQSNSSFIFIDQIYRQKHLVKNLVDICSDLKHKQLSRKEKVDNLIELIKDIEHKDLSKIPEPWKGVFKTGSTSQKRDDYLRLPLNPKVSVIGIYPDDATVFKSATNPVRLSFVTPERRLYKVIFKIGDDLRQDQLIVQLITLMDKLLQKDGLDLKLTPYRVLACSKNEGFLEFVDKSKTFEEIICEGNIRSWLEKQSRGNKNEFETACDNFVKSCAGYCVITYILGIGDRHLENLLLTTDGKLFHIDFGYILGRDPKHFAPPMKLCKEMVEGMGGRESIGYNKFLELCCTAYNVLRKNSHWILNMFVLMVDSGIKDIDQGTRAEHLPSPQKTSDLEPTENVPKVQDTRQTRSDAFKNIMKVQERLKLEYNDEDAIKYIQGVITESERALFAPIHDTVHRWVQYWRN